MADSKEYLAIGEIYREHGIEGAVKVYVYNPDAGNFRKGLKVLVRNAEGRETEATVQQTAPYQRWFLTRFSFLRNPEEAKLWRKAVIYARRQDLAPAEKGEFYVQDLMNYAIADESGALIGRLDGLEGGAAVDLWRIRNDQDQEFIIPAIPEWILKIDPAGKRVVLRLPEGLIEAQLPEKKPQGPS